MSEEEIVEQTVERLDPPGELEGKRNEILRMMKASGITDLTFSFDGSGDSGTSNVESSIPSDAPISAELEEALEEFLNEAISENWWDNDGGFGEIYFSVEEKVANIELSIREMTTTDSNWEV